MLLTQVLTSFIFLSNAGGCGSLGKLLKSRGGLSQTRHFGSKCPVFSLYSVSYIHNFHMILNSMIITIIKAILFVLSSGILFREFISTNHSRKEVKISGIVIVFATVFLFIIDAIPVGSSVDNSSKASSAVNNKPVTPLASKKNNHLSLK